MDTKKRKSSKSLEYTWRERLWYSFIWICLRVTTTLLYRHRNTGLEHIPKTGPVIFVTNHQSHLDPPLIACGCPRQMRFLARKTLFDDGVFGWLIDSLGAIPIDRDGVGLEGIKQTLRTLKIGQAILVFPEGKRSSDGELQPFEPGIVTIAKRSKATIVPGAIEGAYDAFPRGQKFPKLFGRIHVHYDQPIPFDEYGDLSDEDLLALLDQRIRGAQAEILKRPAMARQAERRRAVQNGKSENDAD